LDVEPRLYVARRDPGFAGEGLRCRQQASER